MKCYQNSYYEHVLIYHVFFMDKADWDNGMADVLDKPYPSKTLPGTTASRK